MMMATAANREWLHELRVRAAPKSIDEDKRFLLSLKFSTFLLFYLALSQLDALKKVRIKLEIHNQLVEAAHPSHATDSRHTLESHTAMYNSWYLWSFLSWPAPRKADIETASTF